MKQIIVTVDKEGNVALETKGFAGQGCKSASKALEEALGERKSDKPTAEMYSADTSNKLVQ
jgi:hypothetical protein